MNMDIDEIFPNVEVVAIAKKDYLQREGEVLDYLFFIKKGIVRIVHNNDGVEITAQFFSEGSYISFRGDSFRRIPGKYAIQALEECEVCFIPRSEMFKAFDDPVKSQFLFFMLVDRLRLYQELYLSSISLTAQQRYNQLLETQPEIIQRVAQHYIASYLGITPVSLSRLKGK